MQDLKVAAIQTSLAWESIGDNLRALGNKIEQISNAPDLIILPEMFSTAFSMNSRGLAESMDGKAISWMADQASQSNAVVTGSLIIKEDEKFFNRLIWMRPDGTHIHYDKRHLFRMMDEDQHFSPGSQRIIVTLNGWKVCPLICYDLRFPVWSRNDAGYDCLIYVANWPEPRREAWRTLLRARAHENQTYVVGLNRIGKDFNGINFAGDSVIVDPKGAVINELPNEESILEGSLNYSELHDFREKFPMHLDADSFSLDISRD
ncbi:MAG: amidohydrolase [Flavobacteriales bacterium]|nr:amidohydrolase [Flavobacteriales bacterium]